MTITVEKMPRSWPREKFEADIQDAPPWATRGGTYCSGSMTEPESDGDVRSWEAPIGELEWDSGDFYGPGSLEVKIEQKDIASGDSIETAGPVVTLEHDIQGVDLSKPSDVRILAGMLLKAADELERIQRA